LKRRLRKKKRLGEFLELGFEVRYRIAPRVGAAERDEVLWRFITEAVEPNNLAAGGGGGEEHGFFVVAARNRASATDAQRLAVRGWLAECKEIVESEVGPLCDAWYGREE
jgi:uncharacterized protein YggL (DUF469 family)